MAPESQLEGLGRAVRRLRQSRGLKQFEAAEAAGITKAMLSAYETGKRRPSLTTLGQILEALNADLGDLHRALMAERYGDSMLSEGERRRVLRNGPYPTGEPGGGSEIAEPPDVYQVLGVSRPLPPDEEAALREMLHGFHNLLRYLHRNGPPGAGVITPRRRSTGP